MNNKYIKDTFPLFTKFLKEMFGEGIFISKGVMTRYIKRYIINKSYCNIGELKINVSNKQIKMLVANIQATALGIEPEAVKKSVFKSRDGDITLAYDPVRKDRIDDWTGIPFP